MVAIANTGSLGAAIRDREFMRDTAYRDWDNCLFQLKSHRPMERDLFDYLKSHGLQPDQEVPYHEDPLVPELPGGPWDYQAASRVVGCNGCICRSAGGFCFGDKFRLNINRSSISGVYLLIPLCALLSRGIPALATLIAYLCTPFSLPLFSFPRHPVLRTQIVVSNCSKPSSNR